MSINAAIIGSGALGRTHAAAMSTIDGIEPVAYADIVAERAEAMLAEFGGKYATTDVGQVLADESVDAVYVTTQHDSHADLCIRALAAGKHVMVEKPLAMTMDDCLAVRNQVLASDAKLMVAFKLRYFDMVRKAKSLIPDPIMVSMQLMDNRWADDMWANDPVRGGGNIIAQGCHATDVMRFVAGRDPIDVFASGRNFYQATGVVDNLAAVFRFDDGVTGAWMQGDADCPPFPSKFFLQLFAEGRSVTLSNRLTTLTYHEKGADPVVYQGTETGFREENVEFVASIVDGTEPTIGVDDGLYATAMALQAIRSTETGQPEPIRSVIQESIT